MRKILQRLSVLAVLFTPLAAYAASQSIWGSTDRGPVQGTYRIPVDTSSSSGPGYITPTELDTFLGISVTAGTPNIVISPSPGTGTFTVGISNPINAQGTTTPYTIQATDMGKTVTHSKSSAVAVALPQAGTTGFTSGLSYTECNNGTGNVTITPTTSTILGSSTLVLANTDCAWLFSDGTNWEGFLSASGISGGGTVTSITIGTGLSSTQSPLTTTGTLSASTNSRSRNITFNFDGGGSALTSGKLIYLSNIPYGGTISGNTILADESCSATVDVWMTTYSGAPPTVANTITASDLPTLSSQQKNNDTTLTGWTTSITAGNTMIAKLVTNSGCQFISLTLQVTTN